MAKDLCTIIIPAFNHETYIAECLESIISQTYNNIELIIINDGSTDNTEKVIKYYEDTLKRRFTNYIYLSKENEGICKTLNIGLDLANGDFVSILASDDVMLPDKTLKEITFLNANPQYGLVYSDEYEVHSQTNDKISLKQYTDKDKRSYMYESFFTQNSTKETTLEKLLTGVLAMPTPTVMYQKKLYDAVGKYDETLECEDPDMFLRMAKLTEFGYIPESLVLHRVHSGSHGRNRKRMLSAAYKMYLKYQKIDWLNERQKNIICNTFCNILKSNIFFFPETKGKKLIVWGTGGAYENDKFALREIIPPPTKNLEFLKVEFFIDSNPAKAGMILDGSMIYLPNKLQEINKNDYFIIIASTFKSEIEEMLKEMEFEKGKHF